MTIKVLAFAATIFSWVWQPLSMINKWNKCLDKWFGDCLPYPPPLMQFRSLSTSSAPSIATSSCNAIGQGLLLLFGEWYLLLITYLRVGLQVSKSQSIVNDELTSLKRCRNTHYLQLLLLHTLSCINNDRGTSMLFDDRAQTLKFANLPSRSTANTIVLPLPTPSFWLL